MPSVLISIIVPVFNVEKYLARCINSIINQTYQTIEIILVNDGSTDSSLSICNSFKRIDNRIIVIDKKNGGLSSARNAGLEICSGSYVSFVDSDDYIEADMIETLFYSAFNNGTLLSCCGRFDVFEKENKRQVGLCPLSNENCSSDIALSRLLTWNGIDSSACDKLFSAQLWKSERFPEGRISEDVAVMYLIFEKAGTISFVSKPLYNYCHRSKSITTSSFSSKTYDLLTNVLSIESFVLKNYPNLRKELSFFKYVEYTSFLGLMSKSKKLDKPLAKKLIIEIKKSKKYFGHFSFKQKLRLYVFSHAYAFFIFAFFNSLFRKAK